MQRAQSAVDFSSLLNPESQVQTQVQVQVQVGHDGVRPSLSQFPRNDHDMATVTMIRPNGPLPNGQPSEASSELPRPYKCPMCEKAFHRLEHQTRHIRTHTGEKPHACQFPGCSNKFSRSDELTRHSRIHSNPNSRRAKAMMNAVTYQGEAVSVVMPPLPGAKVIRSAPPSALGSPNVSPPHSFTYSVPPPVGLGAYGRPPPVSHAMDISLLAKAANQVERDTLMAPPPPHHHNHMHNHNHHLTPRPQPYFSHSSSSSSLHSLRGHLPSLSAYHMSRSHSNDEHRDDHYSHAYRQAKRSRPNSPNSTAPSSPAFSHDSLSPTPDHTPLATPAHSPRLRPYSHATYELPPFRQLSLNHTIPALAPLEPQPEVPYSSQGNSTSTASRSKGISLSDILSRPDSSQRKLPVPQVTSKVAVRDLLGPADGLTIASGRSSSSNSAAGGDLLDRN